MRAISSRWRLCSFSRWSSSFRAVSHSSRVAGLCSGIAWLLSSVLIPPYIVSKRANDPFEALAPPTGREIVARLSGGAATVGEASRDLGVSKPTISRHLKLLEEAGVVTRVIEGRTHRLALRPETLADTSKWIEEQRARWERMFDVVGEYLEERKG